MIDLFLNYPAEIRQVFIPETPTELNCSVACQIAQNSLPEIVGASPPALNASPTLPNGPHPNRFEILSIGLNTFKVNQIAASRVRGLEENGQAVDFKKWLIPFDDVVKLLDIQVKILNDGQLELRSPGFVVRINPQELTQDPELGLTIGVETIENRLGVPLSFDGAAYAIIFSPSWLGIKSNAMGSPSTLPVNLDGLPWINAPDLSLSAIGMNYQSSGSSNLPNGSIDNVVNRSQVLGVGTAFGGSWFINVDQNNLEDWTTWSLKEAQYLRQTPQADYAIGSQAPFWSLQQGRDYWGMTTIQRFGFSPPVTDNLNMDQNGGFLPLQRLQSNQLSRTITGEAKPGTLVQLRSAKSKQAIAEVLVDESGTYRFETQNLISNPQSFGSLGQTVDYQLYLYPEGKRSEPPEIRETRLLLLPLQLPTGASALITSAGVGRDFLDNGFFGDFNQFKAGVGYYYGLNEELTIGTGLIQDGNVLPSASLIYQPNGLPVGLSLTSLFGTDNTQGWAYSGGLTYAPNSDLFFQINSTNINQDQLVQSFQLNWRVSPNFNLRFSGNDKDNVLLAGFNVFQQIDNLYVATGFSYGTNNNVLWQGTFGWEKWKLTSFGGGFNTTNNRNNNRFYSNSELSYNFNQWYGTGHAIFLNYNTDYNGSSPHNFASLGWRYQSQELTYDYRPLWLFDLGYGVGSGGNGIVASVGTNAIPGATVRITYQQASLASNRDSFTVQIFPSLSIQPNLAFGDRRFQNLRTRGGLWIQPFLDANSNGILDEGETLYTEAPKQLFSLNNRSLKAVANFNVTPEALILPAQPGTYRLDLDPAGYPLDYQPLHPAYAVEVIAGSYTTVSIPFIPAYTVGGKLVNAQGKPIVGARVEAISVKNYPKVISITDEQGVFYLENLRQGTYEVLAQGKETQPKSLELTQESPALSELTLKLE
ncbi:MAG: carboxypeptidase-like regulatory domain-containing protein [Snowella sp.]|nr:carboxypeptidase-like regulatory domain-containing protein [Snowella sp.]